MKKETGDIQKSKEDVSQKDGRQTPEKIKEINGRAGLEPTRYGDWEKNGRCIDF